MLSVLVEGQAREIALAEIGAVSEHADDPGYRADLELLLAAVEQGEVSEPAAASLGRVLELSLQAGRIRALYGPGGEQAALRLYRRLPAGASVVASAEQVSRALGSLAGKPIESISLRAVGPGAFALSIAAGGAELDVRLDRQGARLASVAV